MENQPIPICYRRSCIHPHQTWFPSPSVLAAFDFHPHPLPQIFSVLHIFVKLSQKYTGYTALHNSQSHRISQSQALSARFIIFCFCYHSNTILNATVPAVLPQSLSSLPRYYRSSCLPRYYRCPHYHAGFYPISGGHSPYPPPGSWLVAGSSAPTLWLIVVRNLSVVCQK